MKTVFIGAFAILFFAGFFRKKSLAQPQRLRSPLLDQFKYRFDIFEHRFQDWINKQLIELLSQVLRTCKIPGVNDSIASKEAFSSSLKEEANYRQYVLNGGLLSSTKGIVYRDQMSKNKTTIILW
jgi:hypothetical protein